jgi:hypothetical protein
MIKFKQKRKKMKMFLSIAFIVCTGCSWGAINGKESPEEAAPSSPSSRLVKHQTGGWFLGLSGEDCYVFPNEASNQIGDKKASVFSPPKNRGECLWWGSFVPLGSNPPSVESGFNRDGEYVTRQTTSEKTFQKRVSSVLTFMMSYP